jgi:hypothetical protein
MPQVVVQSQVSRGRFITSMDALAALAALGVRVVIAVLAVLAAPDLSIALKPIEGTYPRRDTGIPARRRNKNQIRRPGLPDHLLKLAEFCGWTNARSAAYCILVVFARSSRRTE